MTKIFDPKCEYKKNPMGIDVLKPRLSWKLFSEGQGVMQSAYQIHMALTEDDLLNEKELVWDSEKMKTDQSCHVRYDGPDIKSRVRYYWHVRVWDNHDTESGWSEIACFETGLLNPGDWKAKMIRPDIHQDPEKSNPCPMLRKNFFLKKEIVKARLYITAHGIYEAAINGKRVGDELFTPGWTTYQKCLQYQTFDVTDQLRQGENAIGVYLADGWFRGYISYMYTRNVYGKDVSLLAQLEVTYIDGSSETIISDNRWRSSTGPILESDLFNGETYNALLEKPGWDNSGFDNNSWNGVEEVDFDMSILTAPIGVPVKKIEEIKPIAVLNTPKGETVFDFGQNMVGFVRLTLRGAKGQAVTLKHAEVLDQQGNFFTKNLRLARATDTYIFKGSEEAETFEPRFTFHGFRYVMVEGFSEELTLDCLTGIVVHSEMEKTGDFSCSNDLVNRLFQNIVWSQKGNFLDVPTDCPQRDERVGWTGDLQVFSGTACMNMDTAAFLTRWLRDLRHDQWGNGNVPMIVPDAYTRRWDTFKRIVKNAISPRPGENKKFFDEYFALFQLDAACGWGDAVIIVPWNLYLNFGDRGILEAQYESMKSYFNFRKKRSRGFIDYLFINPLKWFRPETWKHKKYFSSDWFGFGDWLAPGDGMEGSIFRSRFFIPSVYMAIDALLLSKISAVLGHVEDANYYQDYYEKIKTAIQYFRLKKNGRMWPHRQSTYVLALIADILPEEDKPKAAKILANMVKNNDYKIGTGFLGTPHICHVLTEHGYPDHAYRLLLNENHQWLYQVKKGATTIWERWDAIKEDGSFQSDRMNSFNHYAYGSIGDFLYKVVAGINFDETKPGFKHIIIRPQPGQNLTRAKASFESVYGLIKSEWSASDDKFVLSVKIPPNTSATVVFPESYSREIFLRDNLLVLKDRSVDIGSGQYEFSCSIKETSKK